LRITKLSILTILFFSQILCGQNRIISGRVISEDLEPLPMVYIQNSDTILLGKTDMDGRFLISIPQETEKLLFGDVGLEWTDIKLKKDCDAIEVIMLYNVTYDFMSFNKIDRLRKKRFDKLPIAHSEAVKKGLFKNNIVCYNREFKPDKPILDSIEKVLKLKSKLINEIFNKFVIGDTIRIPYTAYWRTDGTDRTILHFYSYIADRENFDCIIKGVITDKNRHKGGYNLVYRVIDCNECHHDNIVLNGKELKVGDTIEYNMKYFKILKNK
jgi:hypothetical protein